MEQIRDDADGTRPDERQPFAGISSDLPSQEHTQVEDDEFVETQPRRSERGNFGVGPQRFGEFVTWQERQRTTVRSPPPANLPTSLPVMRREPTSIPDQGSRRRSSTLSSSSRRTFASRSSSTLRTRRLELDAELAAANANVVKMTAEAEIAKAEAMVKVHKAALESTRAQVAAELAKLEEEGNSSDEERRKIIEGGVEDDEDNPGADEQPDNNAEDWRPRLINFAEDASQAPQVTFPESPFNETEAPNIMKDYGFNRVGQGALNLFGEPRTLSEVQPRFPPDALTQSHSGSV
ncbi:unnamed protein product, partial [Allacma fusca]